MAKVLIGNFKGPQGGQGIPGPQGEQGDQGIRGSRWTEGTAITGTSTTPTVFSGTGISDALAEDMYLNTDTGNAYRCTTGGVATVAKWVYACNLKGIKGDTGAKGDPGTAGPKGEKGDTGEQGPKGDTPTVADNMTVAFTQASSRSNIATGEKLSVIMGKIKKFFADLTAPAFAQMITTKEDLLATKVTGYVPDAKAVADTYTELNGKLSKMEIIELTVTTGSGDSVGVAGVSKSMYPTAKAIIPLGYDATLGYRVGCFKVSTDHIFFAIQDAVKGSWANAKTITFKALLI